VKICMISCVDNLDDTRGARIRHALVSGGHQVVAIMPASATSQLPEDGVKHLALPAVTRHFWRDSTLFDLAVAFLLRARNSLVALYWALRERPDACLCQEPDSWLVGLLVKLFSRSAVVVDVQEIYESRADAFPRLVRRPLNRAIRQVMCILSRFSECVIHVSEARRDYYSYLVAPTVVVSHFPPLEGFCIQPPPRDADLDGRFVGVHAGTLRPDYAAVELLTAVERASEVVPELVLLVLGGVAGAEGNFADVVERLQRKKIVQILPEVSFAEVVRWMKMSDIGIALVLEVDINHTLVFPRKLFEYMAAGLPVIGANVGDVRRIILGEGCGRVVDATSPESIAEAIIGLARDAEGRKRMARNARQAAERTYNWSQPAHKLRVLFSEIEAIREGHAPA
jgi:glycosyltransferase involved in cell wall biosynthesis